MSETLTLTTYQSLRKEGPITMALAGRQKQSFNDMIPVFIEYISAMSLPVGPADSPLQYADFIFGQVLAASYLPGIVQLPLPIMPPNPVPGAAAAAPILLEIFRQERDLYKMVNNIIKHAKQIFIWEGGSLISALDQGHAGLAIRSCTEVFTGLHELLGVITDADAADIRAETRRDFKQGLLIATAIGQLQGLHTKLATLGAGYEAGDKDKSQELIALLTKAGPVSGAIASQYLLDTPTAGRTFQTLVDYALTKLNRLQDQAFVISTVFGGASAHAAVGVATPGAAMKSGKSHAELEAAYMAMPISAYCWKCGWGIHAGTVCRQMTDARTNNSPRPKYSQEHLDATKPTKIGGVDGSTRKQLGCRMPN